MEKVFRLFFLLIFLALSAWILWRVPENGWGSLVWLLGTIVMMAIRAPFEATNRKNEIEESRQEVVENVLLAGVFLGAFIIPMAYLASGWPASLRYALPSWATAIGVVLLVLGLWLFWRSHADLGRNWSVTLEIREGHHLVTGGVYSRVRHPMYSAIYLIYGAQALLIHHWIAGLGGIVSFWLIYVIRVPREEAMMRARFGDEYEEYCQSTGRVIPQLFS
ncbi:MAG: protein-S-isoprenylcysteine O-methyltransferase [Acidobacteriota bacterium]